MTILKTDTTRSGQHMIGVHVGQKVFNYLSLYCVAKSTLKARILNDLFLKWVSGQKIAYPETKLINIIIEKLQVQKNRHPEGFLEKAEIELIKKSIPDEVIKKILSEIK